MTLVLFDIDGTLLYSRGCGSAATRLAMQETFGTIGTLEHFVFGGKTDWNMLLETLDGLVAPEEIEGRLHDYNLILGRHLADIIGNYDVQPCPGAPALLDKCLHAPHITVGLLTANMPMAASIKLRAAGYNPAVFAFGVYGSEAPTRNALSAIALTRVNQVKQRTYAPQQVVIVGDTPQDIECARAIDARVIAVATGRYQADVLADHAPDYVVEDLSDTATLWRMITDTTFMPAVLPV